MTSEDWNVIAAVGQCVGAAATFAAVCVALHAESRANTVRLGITIKPAAPPSEFTSGSNLRVIVVNRSNRPVTLMGGGVVLPDGSVNGKQHLQINSLHKEVIKEWDRIEGEVNAELISGELDRKGFRKRAKIWIFVEDATGKRHWKRAWFDPAPYIARQKADQQKKDATFFAKFGQPPNDPLGGGDSAADSNA